MKELTKELHLRRIEKDKQIYFSKSLKLGKGAFGEVYLGFDQAKHMPFACKIISLQKINAQDNQEILIKKIKDEIINMKIVNNEHIVQLKDAKSSERNVYIMCEYCNGDNLEKYLKNRGYLTQFQALTFLKEMLQGFYALRQKHIVHRDIKPANLLMHNYSLKIADLGFSKSIENHEQLLQSIVGSPLYMSPQIFERSKYTEKTDIWSLGVIFYEMLYGKNPFHGCANLMQLKQRVKKDINFPEYPYVSEDTKKMIKRIMVVEEKDRLDWEFLFNKYLLKHPVEPAELEKINYYSISNIIYKYFRESYYIESYQHLHKVLKTIKLCTQQELNNVYPHYETKQQFFGQFHFCSMNKSHIEQYFNYYIQTRNKISYLIILCSKLCSIKLQANNHQFLIWNYCIYLLAYKYSLTLLAEMVNTEGKLTLFNNKYENIYNKFSYEKFMTYLLVKDREMISNQLNLFTSHFRSMLSNLSQTNPQLLSIIQKDLSGVYSSQQGDKRVIGFYLNNYLKKVHSILKENILQQQNSNKIEMIPEQEERLHQKQHKLPSLNVTTCKLIQQYLNNSQLFNLKIQSINQNINNIKSMQFKKNLNQILYDFQTTVEQNYFQKLSSSKPFEQESIISFISKEIKWNNFFIPKLT